MADKPLTIEQQRAASREILEPLQRAQEGAQSTARIKTTRYEFLAGKGQAAPDVVAAARLEMMRAHLDFHRATLAVYIEGLRAAEALIPLQQDALETTRAMGIPALIKRRERYLDDAVKVAQMALANRQIAIADIGRLTDELES